MESQGTQTRQLQQLLDQLRAGDESARDALIEHACERLQRLTHKLKQDFPLVGRWEQTDDIFQQASMRLYGSLKDIQPENVRAFLGLAATQIRRELIDVIRKLKGPEGLAANYATDGPVSQDTTSKPLHRDPSSDTDGPAELSLWTEFHRHVDDLPEEEREVFQNVFYNGTEQAEVAELLDVSIRTVKRRWRSAKVMLHDAVHGEDD
ncbi:MAG: sigma-70 family RNA polymerase sigma factor [Planctomycetes bacterium]|nr:sigma-70 family RNA polymerase sigma factor [Planctomycetota bacterium]